MENLYEKYNKTSIVIPSMTHYTIPEGTGMVIRSCMELLQAKEQLLEEQNIQVTLTGQFVEIYNENVCIDSGYSV